VLAGEVSPTALARTPKPSRTADVPVNFVGMNVGDAIYARGVVPNQQLNKIVASGVESIRVTFDWSEAQPYHTWSQVPMGQAAQFQGDPVPTDFTSSDQIVSRRPGAGCRCCPSC
jgi:hypothetical protein